MSKPADIVWLGVDLYQRWLEVDLAALVNDADGLLEFQLKDIGLVFSRPVQRIKEIAAESGFPVSPFTASSSSESVKQFAILVEEQNIPEAKIGLAAGVCAFLWLYASILGFKPVTVIVTSDLPLGSGLGSSASFCVPISAAHLGKREHIWEHDHVQLGKMKHIKPGMTLRMLITNTKVGRNTEALVAGVSERACRHPDAMTAVFTAVDSISKELADIIESPASDELSITAKEDKLEDLMDMNQGLLQCMGVSHASIETVLQTTLKFKLASKLTGAGGGGCVYYQLCCLQRLVAPVFRLNSAAINDLTILFCNPRRISSTGDADIMIEMH
ncbi:hypothetical protein ACLOJK_039046 [Asimina triloba]